jgi:hypothetical protein
VLPSVAVACGIVPRATMYAARRTPMSAEASRPVPATDAAPARAERFGAIARPASAPQRTATAAAVALVFITLVIAGYPIYRGAQRLAATPEVRRAPFLHAAAHHGDAMAATQHADAGPAVHSLPAPTVAPQPRAGAAPGPQPFVTPGPRPLVAPLKQVSATGKRNEGAAIRTASAARRHAAHAPHSAAHGTHTASLRRGAHRGAVVVAGDVSLHDAALGR